MQRYLFYVATSLSVMGRGIADITQDDVRQSMLDALAGRYIQLEDIRFSLRQFLFVKYKFDLTQGSLLLRIAKARNAECRTVVTKRNYVHTSCYFDISRSVASYYVSQAEGATNHFAGFNTSAIVRKGTVHVSVTLRPPSQKGHGDPLMVTLYVRTITVDVSHPANTFSSWRIQKKFQRKARKYISRKIVEALKKAFKSVEQRLREIWQKSSGRTSTREASTITKATTVEPGTMTPKPFAPRENSTKATSTSTFITNC